MLRHITISGSNQKSVTEGEVKACPCSCVGAWVCGPILCCKYLLNGLADYLQTWWKGSRGETLVPPSLPEVRVKGQILWQYLFSMFPRGNLPLTCNFTYVWWCLELPHYVVAIATEVKDHVTDGQMYTFVPRVGICVLQTLGSNVTGKSSKIRHQMSETKGQIVSKSSLAIILRGHIALT